MSPLFDREAALKSMRLRTFEKRAVATMSGGRPGENPAQQARTMQIVPGASPGGSQATNFTAAGTTNANSLFMANQVMPKKPPTGRTSMAPPKMGTGMPGFSNPGSKSSALSVAKLDKAPARAGMPKMPKVAHALMRKQAKAAAIKGVLSSLKALPARFKAGYRAFTAAPTPAPAAPTSAPVAATRVRRPVPGVHANAGAATPKPPGASASASGADAAKEPGFIESALKGFRDYFSGAAPAGQAASAAPKKGVVDRIKALRETRKQYLDKTTDFGSTLKGGALRAADVGVRRMGNITALGTGASYATNPYRMKYQTNPDGSVKRDKSGRALQTPMTDSSGAPVRADFGTHLKRGLTGAAVLSPAAVFGTRFGMYPAVFGTYAMSKGFSGTPRGRIPGNQPVVAKDQLRQTFMPAADSIRSAASEVTGTASQKRMAARRKAFDRLPPDVRDRLLQSGYRRPGS